MTRILFVDDEIKILEGLQRMLRPQRRDWEMAFAPGGKAALTMLEASPFDVIVSDMRMPEIDGAALRKLKPTVSIVFEDLRRAPHPSSVQSVA